MSTEQDRYTEAYMGQHILVETSPPLIREKTAVASEYTYFKVRSSVYDSDGKQIKQSVQIDEVKTKSADEARQVGIDAAKFWANTSR